MDFQNDTLSDTQTHRRMNPQTAGLADRWTHRHEFADSRTRRQMDSQKDKLRDGLTLIGGDDPSSIFAGSSSCDVVPVTLQKILSVVLKVVEYANMRAYIQCGTTTC